MIIRSLQIDYHNSTVNGDIRVKILTLTPVPTCSFSNTLSGPQGAVSSCVPRHHPPGTHAPTQRSAQAPAPPPQFPKSPQVPYNPTHEKEENWLSWKPQKTCLSLALSGFYGRSWCRPWATPHAHKTVRHRLLARQGIVESKGNWVQERNAGPGSISPDLLGSALQHPIFYVGKLRQQELGVRSVERDWASTWGTSCWRSQLGPGRKMGQLRGCCW